MEDRESEFTKEVLFEQEMRAEGDILRQEEAE